MNEYKLKLLDYISKNYDDVVKSADGGEYIEIDLVPNGHDSMLSLDEILDCWEKNGIDARMFIRSYGMKIGDGIRMDRYVYYMQETTKRILKDLTIFNK